MLPCAPVSAARDREIARHRAEAARLRQESDAALGRGDRAAGLTASQQAIYHEEVAQLLEDGEPWAGEGLRSGNDSGITSSVTKAQKRRRGLAIAAGKAADRTAGRDIAEAITADKRWGSLTAYAKRRLRISQPALSRYLSGDLDVPDEVRAAVLQDFGLAEWPPRKR